MAENGNSNNQTKHVNTLYHFTRELIEEGTIEVKFVKLEDNNSNIFTKNWGTESFNHHIGTFMNEHDKL